MGPISPLWLGYQLIIVRDFVGKFVPMKLVEKLVPRYGLGVVVNQDGKMVNSVHDASGKYIKSSFMNSVLNDALQVLMA